MNIRFAKKKDLSQIIELCQTHAEYEQIEYVQKNKAVSLSKLIFGRNPRIKCLVIEQENSIIGYATFMKQFSTWDADIYLYLDCLFLKSNARGLGLGLRLMEKVKDYAKAENCKIIQWQTPKFNQKAIGFYRKIGGISTVKERFSWNI